MAVSANEPYLLRYCHKYTYEAYQLSKLYILL